MTENIHPVYRSELNKALLSCSHEGSLNAVDGLVLVKSSKEGIALFALVDPSNTIVKRAAYSGTMSTIQKGLLEVLCGIVEGKPIQECSDHTVINLEYKLRDHSQSPPVDGIITPESADKAFNLPTNLVHGLLADYRNNTGYTGVENFYDQPVSPQWRNVSKEERIRQLQDVINRYHTDFGITVVGLESARRVVIKFNDELDEYTKQSIMMQLETHIKNMIDSTLQLYLQPRLDENEIRTIRKVHES